jgi:hypothetical protein
MSMDGLYDAKSQEGGANMSMDGLADICSCNICTSTIRGGGITQRARDGNANMFIDEQYIAWSQ